MIGVDRSKLPKEATPLEFVALWIETNKPLLTELKIHSVLQQVLDSDILACVAPDPVYRQKDET